MHRRRDVVTLDDLRRFAVARSFFPPTTLQRAINKLGFVQADPIRAPARAQDLMLRHRVKGYRAGDLERRYATLGVEEDTFINYGFVSSFVHTLMHPRVFAPDWSKSQLKRVQAVLEFVSQRGTVHPRDVDEHFSHGTVTNYWGGSSNATTHLMDHMHYRGLLRVVRRERGVRIYGSRSLPLAAYGQVSDKPAPWRSAEGPSPKVRLSVEAQDGQAAATLTQGRPGAPMEPSARVDALVDVVVNKYAPLPATSLSYAVSRLRYAVPQWHRELKRALQRAKQRLAHARIDNLDWYWPADELVLQNAPQEMVRLLAPFDPVVWDRRRFELLWGWAYRFEAYTPGPKRKLGYYALPLLWRDCVIGWGNVSVTNGKLQAELGYVDPHAPRGRNFRRELEAELDRLSVFLGTQPSDSKSQGNRTR